MGKILEKCIKEPVKEPVSSPAELLFNGIAQALSYRTLCIHDSGKAISKEHLSLAISDFWLLYSTRKESKRHEENNIQASLFHLQQRLVSQVIT